jgi:hypothetical protein
MRMVEQMITGTPSKPKLAPTFELVRIEPGPRTTAAITMAGPMDWRSFFIIYLKLEEGSEDQNG